MGPRPHGDTRPYVCVRIGGPTTCATLCHMALGMRLARAACVPMPTWAYRAARVCLATSVPTTAAYTRLHVRPRLTCAWCAPKRLHVSVCLHGPTCGLCNICARRCKADGMVIAGGKHVVRHIISSFQMSSERRTACGTLGHLELFLFLNFTMSMTI